MRSKIIIGFILFLLFVSSFFYFDKSWFLRNKEYFEFLTSLSGPIVALLALFGLKQIRLTKEIARMNESRRLFEMTSERCEYFDREVANKIFEIEQRMGKDEVHLFEKCKFSYTNKKLSNSELIDPDSEEFKKAQPYFVELIKIFNKTNVYAVAMHTGIANEKLAYITDARIFCQFIEDYYLVILFGCLDEDDNDKEVYINTHGGDHAIELYKMWRGRIEREKIQRELSSIDERRRSILKKLGDNDQVKENA